jgi:hypothetical protein
MVLFFFMAGFLLHFECVHWELIASRWEPAFSFHLGERL